VCLLSNELIRESCFSPTDPSVGAAVAATGSVENSNEDGSSDDEDVIFVGNGNSDSVEQDDDDIQFVEINGGSNSDDKATGDSDSDTDTDSGPDLTDGDPEEEAAWEQLMAEEKASGQLQPGLRAWVRSGRHPAFFFGRIYEEEAESSSDMEDGENEV